ncbi:hypothetical protein QCA50_005228 [Cerrena zonata]|uniref:N2227-domain-containing protein n=1 Tax=Cerrena zonata TaxID=2478898 RepID=A0AAW0GQJ3_9APHY
MNNTSSSDLSTLKAVVACALPFLIILVFYVIFEPENARTSFIEMLQGLSFRRATRWTRFTRHRSAFGPFSLPKAITSYDQYLETSLENITAMRNSYSRIIWSHKHVGYELGYPEKLKQAEHVVKLNAEVTRGIVDLARSELSEHPHCNTPYVQTDLGRVQESLKHFVRDWSEEGAQERGRIFEPILNVLKDVPVEQRGGMKVLVPGSGLGRLAWEISELGFNTTAIEFSYFMTLGMRFLCSPQKTLNVNQHTIYPYANWFSHTRNNEDLFRGIPFPDAVPRFGRNLHLIEGDFLEYGHADEYDFVVSLFFIDTSLNIISTLQHIHKLLKPAGTWINLGPLLWTSGGRAQLELSLDEVLRLAGMVGFRIEGEEVQDHNGDNHARLDPVSIPSDNKKRRTVECEYTANRLAMMRWLYQAEFWVGTKLKQ